MLSIFFEGHDHILIRKTEQLSMIIILKYLRCFFDINIDYTKYKKGRMAQETTPYFLLGIAITLEKKERMRGWSSILLLKLRF